MTTAVIPCAAQRGAVRRRHAILMPALAARCRISLAEFVRYKTLVGFKGVFPPDWEDEEFFLGHDQYRSERAAEFVDLITEADADQWLNFVELCAATKSNDLAISLSSESFSSSWQPLNPP